jgi:hypothetical protein
MVWLVSQCEYTFDVATCLEEQFIAHDCLDAYGDLHLSFAIVDTFQACTY